MWLNCEGVEVGKEPGTWCRSWLGHLLTEGLERLHLSKPRFPHYKMGAMPSTFQGRGGSERNNPQEKLCGLEPAV